MWNVIRDRESGMNSDNLHKRARNCVYHFHAISLRRLKRTGLIICVLYTLYDRFVPMLQYFIVHQID